MTKRVIDYTDPYKYEIIPFHILYGDEIIPSKENYKEFFAHIPNAIAIVSNQHESLPQLRGELFEKFESFVDTESIDNDFLFKLQKFIYELRSYYCRK